MSNPYRVDIEMGDNGWWTVDVPDVPGAHSEAQTLARARHNAKVVIALMLSLPAGAEDDIELDEHVRFPAGVEHALRQVYELRVEAERVNHMLRGARDEALAIIDKEFPALGLRDQAELLGLSYQRIQQLRPGAPRRGRKAAPIG